jgi:hypothetical protein
MRATSKAIGIITALLLAWASGSPALADADAQFQMPGLRAPDDSSVDGFRASLLYGELDSMRGFDLGIFSLSKSGQLEGFGFVFGAAWITGSSSGCSAALINVNEGSSTGVLAGFVNKTDSMNDGVNLGFVNFTEGYSEVDVSGLGISDHSNVQVGFVNVTKQIDSVQIGFINAAENGFFPVFPFFNYPK